MNGYAIELNNCLEEAKMQLGVANGEASGLINKLLEFGRFAIVSESSRYCKSTDAYCGVFRGLVTHFATREEADSYITELYQSLEKNGFLDDEVRYFVLPRIPNPPSIPWDYNPEEVPF